MTYSVSRFLHGVAWLMLAVTSMALADSTPEAVIRNHFRTYLNQTPDEVRKTDYGNLYEVRLGTDIVYSDPNGLYLIMGNIIDIKSKKNLTEERVDQVSKIDFSTLPKQYAIKIVRGDGSAQMAVFSDPNCKHCKYLEKNLQKVNDVTIYMFPVPLLSDSSRTLADNVWCSDSPAKSWQNWMLNGVKPVKTKVSCSLPGKEIKQLAESLGIRGTPTVFFSDGTRVPGAIEAKDINFKLKTLR